MPSIVRKEVLVSLRRSWKEVKQMDPRIVIIAVKVAKELLKK